MHITFVSIVPIGFRSTEKHVADSAYSVKNVRFRNFSRTSRNGVKPMLLCIKRQPVTDGDKLLTISVTTGCGQRPLTR